MILVWKWVPPLLLLELDSVIRVQKNRREEVYELFRIFQSMEKKQLCHFLDISSYTKGLNTCICVCVCVCEIQQSKYDVIQVFWHSKMEQNYFSYYLPKVIENDMKYILQEKKNQVFF